MSSRFSTRTLLRRFFRNPVVLSFVAGFGWLFLFMFLFTPADTPLYTFGYCASIFISFSIFLVGHVVQLIRLLRAPERKFWHYPIFIYLGIVILYVGISAIASLFLYPLL